MYPRGSIYNTQNRQWRVESEHSQGIWKDKSQDILNSMRKTPNFFGFMDTSLCTQVFAKKMRIHMSIGLKVSYTHKQVFWGDFIGTSKYNKIKGGPRSMQRDMEGHKYVIN